MVVFTLLLWWRILFPSELQINNKILIFLSTSTTLEWNMSRVCSKLHCQEHEHLCHKWFCLIRMMFAALRGSFLFIIISQLSYLINMVYVRSEGHYLIVGWVLERRSLVVVPLPALAVRFVCAHEKFVLIKAALRSFAFICLTSYVFQLGYARI